MKEKKRTIDELRQVKTYGYKEPMIHERNPDSGEIRSRPIGDKIDDAIDKLLK